MPNVNDIRVLLYAMDKGLLDQSLVAACVSDILESERKREPLTVVEVTRRRGLLTEDQVRRLFQEVLDVAASGQQVVGSDTFIALSEADGRDMSLRLWGEEIAGYKLVRKLAGNGMETSLEGRDAEGKRVTIRILSGEATANKMILDEFLRQAELAKSIEHPCFTRIREVGYDEFYYVITDYAEGRTMGSYVQKRLLSPKDALQVCSQVARMCSFLHHWGFVHRDIQPANIVIDDDQEVCLINPALGRDLLRQIAFGKPLAKLLGTPAYLAPEQAVEDPSGVGTWSDVYAIGSVLFRAVSGSFPHVGSSFSGTLEFISSLQPPPLRILRPDAPVELELLISQAMTKDPAMRPTASQLAESIGMLIRDVPLDHLQPPSSGVAL